MTQEKKLVEEAWNGYRMAAIPLGASPEQVIDCRRAFYAGATALLGAIMTELDPSDDVKDQDLKLVMGVEKELVEFAFAQLRGLNS